ncbi:iron uptake porin [Altericista sp. CCNU0014]|uniref:iron uptake porin n=1 Tax=Altericista sp. CCNU0014 TaxID=3082949 RepID=UPI00384C4637
MKLTLLSAGSLCLFGFATASVPVHALPSPDSLDQVTSVSQLSDVQPTDWAFQALQSLVERYGCIAGYPDGTFRGNRAATRYELAAALNACLDQIGDRFATKEDLAAVQALQEEFKTELATLKGRVDGLEARTKTLEAQQFSTTTKLQGQAIFGVQYGDRLNTAGTDSRATAIARVRLSFNTSFNGSDLLETTLETGNGGTDFVGGSGLALDGSGVDYAGAGPNVTLQRLAYSFKPTKNLSVTVGPVLEAADFIDANSYANDEAEDFSSSFFINNPLIVATEPGAGAGFDWNVAGGPFSIRAAFVASNATNSAGNIDLDGDGIPENGGLSGDPYQASAELEYAKSFGKEDKNKIAVRLQYTRSSVFNLHQNVVGLNAEATFGRFGVFGRAGYSIDPTFTNVKQADYFLTWMAGAGVRDLFIPGSLLAVAGGQPLVIQGEQGPEQTNFEAFYRFPINDNISITPAVIVIADPANGSGEPIIQGMLRTTFSF